MKLTIEEKWIIGGFSLSLLLTGFFSFVSYRNIARLIQSTIQVEHTHAVLTNLNSVATLVLDADTERRYYLLSGKQTYLEHYNADIQTLDQKIAQLQLQEITDPSVQQKLVLLDVLITQWRSVTNQTLHSVPKPAPNPSSPTNSLDQSQQIRSEIQRLTDDIQVGKNEQLQQWVNRVQADTRYRVLIEFSSTFLSFGILFVTFILLYRQTLKRQRAETERQQAEVRQQALSQEKALSELKLRFFSMVSHEFRTPLSLILGSAQLLGADDRDWTVEKRRNNLERIQSAARAMNQLLTDTLTLTRAEAGKLEFAPSWMEIESFCLNLIEDLQVLDEFNHEIQFTSSGYIPLLWLDEKLIYSILSNLLSNAIKYSPQGGIIQFNLDARNDALIFQIKDHGIGIPVEAQQHLFEPFHRADNVGTIEGTGVGLAVVKKCIDLHQGEVYLESKIGLGTTVTVYIPKKS
jgi:signal transduction histidine kinase